jgi:ABC-type transporter Mla subunit MlaD
MNLDALTTAIAAFGAVIAALFGIYRASGGHVKPAEQSVAPSLPSMVSQFNGRIKDIEESIESLSRVLHDSKRTMETISGHQQKSVGELESMNRMLGRIENNQANLHRTLETIKSHDETAVQILGQIREFVRVRGMHRSG